MWLEISYKSKIFWNKNFMSGWKFSVVRVFSKRGSRFGLRFFSLVVLVERKVQPGCFCSDRIKFGRGGVVWVQYFSFFI